MEAASAKTIRRELVQQYRGLRAWRRRPWIWFAWVFVLGGALTVSSFGADYYEPQRTQNYGELVQATVLPSWDGGRNVPIRWRNPKSGAVLDIVVVDDVDTVDRVGPVRLRVMRDHEDEGRTEGSLAPAHVVTDSRILIDGPVDTTSWRIGLWWTLGVLLVVGAWAWRRARRVRRGAQVLAAAAGSAGPAGPSGSLVAVPRRGVLLPRRWTLAVFDVHAGPEAPSVYRARVSPQAGPPGPRPVEVHGDLRRWRTAVLVEPTTGLRWVPVGRPLRQHVNPSVSKATDLDRWWPTGLALVVVGLALLITGAVRHRDLIGALADRSEPVTVTLARRVPVGGATVPVSYQVNGRRQQAQVRFGGPQAEGARAVLRRDPEQPGVLWQDGTSSAPTTGGNTIADLLQTSGSLFAIGGLFLLRRPRTSREAGPPAFAAPEPAWAPPPGWVGPAYPPWVGPPPPPPWSPGSPASPVAPGPWTGAPSELQPTTTSRPPGWVPPPTAPAPSPMPPAPGWPPPEVRPPDPPPAPSHHDEPRVTDQVDETPPASAPDKLLPGTLRLPGRTSPAHAAEPEETDSGS